MTHDSGVADAHAACARRAWTAACSGFAAADASGELGADDLEAWGLAAFLTGRDEESDRARERAHHAYLAAGDAEGATRVVFWLGLALTIRGQGARGAGWFTCVRTTLPPDRFATSVWAGYDRLTAGMMTLFSGRAAEATALLEQALQTARAHDDASLRVLAGNGYGQALLAVGRDKEGMAVLDETMVLAMTGPANPQAVGLVYCAVLSACRGRLDLRRCTEWTEALSRWCAAQLDLVPYRGQCLVHRSELLQLRGRWEESAAEVDQALARLQHSPSDLAAGLAHYQRGELHRVRGEHDDAERAYRAALRTGHDPQPGLALLRAAQGKTDIALLALRRAATEARPGHDRAVLLPALVEVALVAGEPGIAAEAADELGGLVSESALVRAASAHANGAVLLARDEPHAALLELRRAVEEWHRLDAPYDAARTRVLLAEACRALGDEETARLEAEEARGVFEALGARHDLRLLDARGAGSSPPAGLTPREVEVLRLVATGVTNRQIAEHLVLSERTVARHVANIFLKLDVSSRSAATAFAFEHALV